MNSSCTLLLFWRCNLANTAEFGHFQELLILIFSLEKLKKGPSHRNSDSRMDNAASFTVEHVKTGSPSLTQVRELLTYKEATGCTLKLTFFDFENISIFESQL